MALDTTIKKQALAALRDLKAQKLSIPDEAAATRVIAAEFVAASQSLEGYQTTRAQVLAAADEQRLAQESSIEAIDRAIDEHEPGDLANILARGFVLQRSRGRSAHRPIR
jgi:hypothetical protein